MKNRANVYFKTGCEFARTNGTFERDGVYLYKCLKLMKIQYDSLWFRITPLEDCYGA